MKKKLFASLKKALFALLVGILFSSQLYAQNISVKGHVKDAKTGEEIIGASIVVKGTTTGTVSDVDGNFTLNAPPQSTITVAFLGYKAKEFTATTNFVTIALEEDAIMLGEIVAIGYGSQKKKELTGSVSSLKFEDFNAGIKNNPLGLMQGRVAGLTISKQGGADPTNTGYNIQIRGFSTLDQGAGTKPLYIVDGIPVDNIDNISPDEIASFDILKDGSAAAIYGTRGTNGVIIITTKRGLTPDGKESGNTIIEYSGYASVSTITGNTGMATPSEFRDLEKLSGGKIKPTIFDDGSGNSYNTDWMKELTRPAALTHNHNVAISGVTKNMGYRGSVNFKNAEGIAKESNRQEVIAKLAANQKALDGWLDMQYDLSYMNYRNDYFCGDFKQAAIVNPTYPVYDKSTESGYFKPQGTGQSNPVEGMVQRTAYQDGNYFRGSVRPTINILPVPGLKASAFFALEEGDNYQYWNNKTINTNFEDSGKAGRGGDDKTSRNINKLFEVTVDYVTQFDAHTITSVLGFSHQNFLYDHINVSNGGFPTENAYWNIGNGDASKEKLKVDSWRSANTLAALFGRVNYNYADKYLLSASVRREGSSRFGANNKWGWFPAVSTGWRITGEEFMSNAKWLNDLKLRAGFGLTGNNLGSDFMSRKLLDNGGIMWYNNEWVYTYTVKQDENRDLRWERKYEYNAGVDFSALDNRFFGTIDVYFRQTKDLLWKYNVPQPPYQFEIYLANAGEMKSKGLEITLNGVPVRNRDFTWTTSPLISFNRNIITKLSGGSEYFNYSELSTGGVGENGIQNTNTQILKEGEPVGVFYGYKFYGFDDEGNWIYKTPQGGYVLASDANESHKQVIGNAQPLFTFGWTNTFTYKRWDASIFFRGVYGNDVLNVARWAYGPDASQSLNVYLQDAKDGVCTNKRNFSDYYLENGSFVKLDNVTVGYNVPVKNNKFIQSARVYATGQNLLCITAYGGLDPEINVTSVWDSGINYPSFYPITSNFLVGLNMTFK